MPDRILWNVLCFADQRVFFLSFLSITKVQTAGNPFSGNPNNAVNHLDEIKEFNTDLIEMETGSFYLMADLLEIPGTALLVVSDIRRRALHW